MAPATLLMLHSNKLRRRDHFTEALAALQLMVATYTSVQQEDLFMHTAMGLMDKAILYSLWLDKFKLRLLWLVMEIQQSQA